MNIHSVAKRVVAILVPIAVCFAPIPVYSAQRTFVSTSGIDNPACSIAAPCRQFAAAMAATAAGGEIIVLDSGGYGKVTITQSVSIIAPLGIYAGVTVFPGDDGVTIMAGVNDKVVLRGIAISGQGGNRGMHVASNTEVHVEQCTISNMVSHGIQIDGNAHVHLRSTIVRSNGANGLYAATGNPEIHISDSDFARNSDAGIVVQVGTLVGDHVRAVDNANQGLRSAPQGGASASVTLVDSSLAGNTTGVIATALDAGSSVRANFIRTTSEQNAATGFYAQGVFGSANLLVSDSAAVANDLGVYASGDGVIATVSGSTLAGNSSTDLSGGSTGILRSSGNNTLTGRGAADCVCTITANPLK